MLVKMYGAHVLYVTALFASPWTALLDTLAWMRDSLHYRVCAPCGVMACSQFVILYVSLHSIRVHWTHEPK